jgi:carbon-monoxide dehydrogenase medium subunit
MTADATVSSLALAPRQTFPIRLTSAEQQLKGGALDAVTVKRAIIEALADVAPLSDLHASAEYRRRVAVSLATQAVADARAHAIGKKHDAN